MSVSPTFSDEDAEEDAMIENAVAMELIRELGGDPYKLQWIESINCLFCKTCKYCVSRPIDGVVSPVTSSYKPTKEQNIYTTTHHLQRCHKVAAASIRKLSEKLHASKHMMICGKAVLEGFIYNIKAGGSAPWFADGNYKTRIPELPVYKGIICSLCGYCAGVKKSMSTHYSTYHKGSSLDVSSKSRKQAVQVIFGTTHNNYFPVHASEDSDLEDAIDDAPTQEAWYQQCLNVRNLNDTPLNEDGDLDGSSNFYGRSGFNGFLELFKDDRETLMQLSMIPLESEPGNDTANLSIDVPPKVLSITRHLLDQIQNEIQNSNNRLLEYASICFDNSHIANICS